MNNATPNLSNSSEKPKPQPLTLMQPHEFYSLPEVEEQFLVDQLIPLSGLSLLIGNPKDGKSCLARQLAVDVAQGKDFLGMKTMQAGVIYFALEENVWQVQRRMKAAGFTYNDPVYPYTEPILGTKAEIEARLEATLTIYPNVKFLIIDTLFKMSRVKDTNAYMDTQNGVEWLHNLAMRREIAILALHHTKKAIAAENRSSGNISGSNAIAGGVSNILELSRQKADSASSPRILRMNEFRYGKELEPTILSFDDKSQRYTVFGSVSELKKQDAQTGRREIEKEIIRYIADDPGCEQADIVQSIHGNTRDIKAIFYDLLKGEQPALRREGGGVKGDPYQYYLTELPMERIGHVRENHAQGVIN